MHEKKVKNNVESKNWMLTKHIGTSTFSCEMYLLIYIYRIEVEKNRIFPFDKWCIVLLIVIGFFENDWKSWNSFKTTKPIHAAGFPSFWILGHFLFYAFKISFSISVIYCKFHARYCVNLSFEWRFARQYIPWFGDSKNSTTFSVMKLFFLLKKWSVEDQNRYTKSVFVCLIIMLLKIMEMSGKIILLPARRSTKI